MSLVVANPTPSYLIDLPVGISEDSNARVTSYWKSGEPVLLQLSSYLRESGEQISASERLSDRFRSDPDGWRQLDAQMFAIPHVDQASAETTDSDGNLWLHTYLVWPHLTIYSTLSGPNSQKSLLESWAAKAIASIRLNVH